MRMENTSVLIVGAGLAGLSTAAYLSHWGVRPILVERHESTSRHPRARGINPRTMELLDLLGVADQVRGTDSARALAGNRGIRAVETLAGSEYGELHAPYFVDTDADISDLTPQHWCLCDQDELEPILYARAAELGADVRFSTRLTGFAQQPGEVVADLHDLATGEDYQVRSPFLVAADGAGSGIREQLGIHSSGPGSLAHYLNIHFRADLAEPLGDRRFILSYVVNEHLMGALVPVDNRENWLLHVMYDPASGQSPADFPDERCIDLVRSAAGLPDLDVKIRSVLPWEGAGLTADSFQQGRVLLVGDAAHVMPPSGAFGSNTGIQDAVNLAWKLAAVSSGVAGRRLLDTYDAERRPVAAATVEQAVLRSKDRPVLLGEEFEGSPGILPDQVVHFGQFYHSRAVVNGKAGAAMSANAAAAAFADTGQPVWAERWDGRPGTRAPHAAVLVAGRPASVLSLFGRRWTVLLGERAEPVQRVIAPVAARLRLPLDCHRFGDGLALAEPAAGEPYTDPDLVLLVRPDGFVAWRGHAGGLTDPESALAGVLRTVLCQ